MSSESDCGRVEGIARALADRSGAVYLSPYNDMLVAAGQGTAGVEIVDQLAESEARIASVRTASGGDAAAHPPGPLVVFVPVGGGGLICGVAAALKARRPGPGQCVVIGTQPSEVRTHRDSVKDTPSVHYNSTLVSCLASIQRVSSPSNRAV